VLTLGSAPAGDIVATVYKDGSAAKRSTISDRVHSRAAALARQHHGLSLDDALKAVLAKDPTLARAFQMEQQAA
jgi:hypothetical protein